jgi:hypothetical protein
MQAASPGPYSYLLSSDSPAPLARSLTDPSPMGCFSLSASTGGEREVMSVGGLQRVVSRLRVAGSLTGVREPHIPASPRFDGRVALIIIRGISTLLQSTSLCHLTCDATAHLCHKTLLALHPFWARARSVVVPTPGMIGQNPIPGRLTSC